MVFLLIALGVAVLFVRIGFALYAAGLVRAKNSAGTVMRTIADLCISVLAFWAIGAAFLWQNSNGTISINTQLVFGPHQTVTIAQFASVFFNLTMILAVSSVVGGAVAERCRFFPLCIVSLVLAGLVFPVAGNWAWRGWLWNKGFLDIAGASALHVSAGVFALVAVIFVGPRRGKFNRDGSSSMIPGHNLPMASVGVLLMLVGWIAYVVGSSGVWTDPQVRLAQQVVEQDSTARSNPKMSDPKARQAYLESAMAQDANAKREALQVLPYVKAFAAAMNVLLSAAAAALATMLVAKIRYGKPDIVLTLTGLLGGMVAICAGASEVPGWAAVVIGAVAGVIIPLAIAAIDLRLRLDDPLGIIAIHAVGGVWGTLAAGIFVVEPFALSKSQVNGKMIVEHSRLAQIGIQFIGLISIALLAALVAVILFLALRAMGGLRLKEADEFDGLDLAEHDIGAYPDFQQNSIKSYHMREA